ncbi:hypothetical protein [Sulfurimonas marina]|uniref:Uncharacterized protein n=1 Tax=Sulfurimonas marina TaxID=2590551 RepID=A0A7M1AV20_9BACT|nr:hypothetical protein [Sulfurimonas marina]QOP41260.1 hypothetical protein FJR03_05680 [Sulfurimonas marina]
METSTDYVNHVSIVKELNIYQNAEDSRKNALTFEAVYEKAKKADVKVDTAKDFINSLSRNEQFSIGFSPSDLDSLSNEGAYNLLVHNYERYDWNNDGVTEDGLAKTLPMIPQNMDDDAKKAWVKAINAMGDDMMAVMTISFQLNEEYTKRQIAEHLSQMSDSEIDEMQKHASFDIREFIEETLSKPYVPKTLTFLDIMDKINQTINPPAEGYSSPELKESAQKLKEALERAYAEIQIQKQEEQLVTQQQIEFIEEADKMLNKEKENELAKAIKEI